MYSCQSIAQCLPLCHCLSHTTPTQHHVFNDAHVVPVAMLVLECPQELLELALHLVPDRLILQPLRDLALVVVQVQ